MGLFDSPTHLLIILAVLVVLFGSAKLPKAAKSMGEAMRIFKKESAKLHEEDPSEPKKVQEWTPQQQVAPPQAQVTPQQTAQEQQVAALQQQLDALKQQQMAGQQPPPAEPPTTPAPQQTNQSS